MKQYILIDDTYHFLSPKLTLDKINMLYEISQNIKTALKDHPNFDKVDFCDVSAGGIQIRGHHKDIANYCYGDQITIKYDFSNVNEAVDDFIKMWKACDNPDSLKSYKDFLAAGEKYGWD